MKSTLKLSLVAAVLGLSTVAFLRADDQPAAPSPAPSTPPPAAEQGQHRGGRMSPEMMLQRMAEHLNLSEDQKAKILPLLQAQAEQMKALMRDDSLSREDRREKMRPIMQATHEKIRALLTPDQQEKFDSMRRPGRGERGEHNGPPPPPPPAPSE